MKTKNSKFKKIEQKVGTILNYTYVCVYKLYGHMHIHIYTYANLYLHINICIDSDA